VKTPEQAAAALAAGADYLGAGAVFPTATKETDTISAETLAAICAAVPIPVVAIGGITAANAGIAVDAGCSGVAVVSALFDQPDVAIASRAVLAAVTQRLEARKKAAPPPSTNS